MARILLLIFLPLAAYCCSLSSPFKTMDDQYSIVHNPLIKDAGLWPQLFTHGYFNDRSYYRPLANVSFLLEYKFFGLNSFYYNLDNLLIHIANAFLVWMLVGILVNREVGFLTALLFAIHPIQWEAITNISGRAILLSAFFCLASFIAYLKNRPAAAFLSFAAAMLCKESSAVLPGILFVHALLYRRGISWIVPWAALIGAYAWLRHSLGITEMFPWRNPTEYVLGSLTFLQSVLTDVRLLALPVDLHFDRSLKLIGGIFEPAAFLTTAVYVLLLSALWINRAHLSTLHWLALAWFAMSLLPVSQLLTTIGVAPGYISTAEHFMYFACIPVFIIAAQALWTHQNSAVVLLAGGLMVFFVLGAFEQSIYARSELAMMERSLSFQPNNARLQSSVGLIYALSGKFPVAEAHFRAAVAADPMNARYQISLGKSLCDQGRVQECLDVYSRIQNPGSLAPLLQNNKQAALGLLK